jgi:hypothetical protein
VKAASGGSSAAAVKTAFASASAISTVAFQVRNSLAVKWPPAWLELYNARRRHTTLGGHPPISRL